MCVKINKWLKRVWTNMKQDPVEAYLAQATDVVDLEQRLRTVTYRMINKNFHGGKNG